MSNCLADLPTVSRLSKTLTIVSDAKRQFSSSSAYWLSLQQGTRSDLSSALIAFFTSFGSPSSCQLSHAAIEIAAVNRAKVIIIDLCI